MGRENEYIAACRNFLRDGYKSEYVKEHLDMLEQEKESLLKYIEGYQDTPKHNSLIIHCLKELADILAYYLSHVHRDNIAISKNPQKFYEDRISEIDNLQYVDYALRDIQEVIIQLLEIYVIHHPELVKRNAAFLFPLFREHDPKSKFYKTIKKWAKNKTPKSTLYWGGVNTMPFEISNAYDGLIRYGFIEKNSTSKETFIYNFSGQPLENVKPIYWKGSTILLVYFLDRVFEGKDTFWKAIVVEGKLFYNNKGKPISESYIYACQNDISKRGNPKGYDLIDKILNKKP